MKSKKTITELMSQDFGPLIAMLKHFRIGLRIHKNIHNESLNSAVSLTQRSQFYFCFVLQDI